MTDRQQQHLNSLMASFLREYQPKFTRGTVEHSGDLQDVPIMKLLEYAKEEVLDQWSYLKTLEERLKLLADNPQLSGLLKLPQEQSDIPDFQPRLGNPQHPQD